MEEGLKVILSADVNQFQEAFARAAQTTKQKVTEINQTLTTTGKAAEQAAKTWQTFVGERMSQYMKDFGSHGAALRKIAEEWKVYKDSIANAGAAGKIIEGTISAVSKLAGESAKLSTVKMPTAEGLAAGLVKAEAALKKLGETGGSLKLLDNAITLLNANKAGLSDTTAITTLIASLQQLKTIAADLKGTPIRLSADVSEATRSVERIRQVIASQDYRFSVSADANPLQAALQEAARSTSGAVDAITAKLSTLNGTFSAIGANTKKSLTDIVKDFNVLSAAPSTIVTRVAKPDIAPVQDAVRKVKSEISGAFLIALPSTDNLITGLNKAELAVKKFSEGKAYVRDLNAAISALNQSKTGLSDTKAIEQLVRSLQDLKAAKAALNNEAVKPLADTSEASRNIEKIRALIARQDFTFTISANDASLQDSLQRSEAATRSTTEGIKSQLGSLGATFGTVANDARNSISDIVRNFNLLSNAPASIVTRIQPPDVTPVIEAVRKVKQELSGASLTALPSIRLSADVQDAIRSFGQASNVLKQFGAEGVRNLNDVELAIAELNRIARSSTIPAEVTKANKAIQELQREAARMKNVGKEGFDQLGNAIRKTTVDTSKFSEQGKRGTQTLIDLGRVAQDLPYAFNNFGAVANNINPLFESFTRLKAETGSIKGAFSALAGGLVGAGGIGLAISTVTSLLVIFGDEIFTASKKIDGMSMDLNAFALEAEAAGKRITSLRGEIEHLNQLAAIDLQVRFDDKNKVNLLDLQGQSVLNTEELYRLQNEVNTLLDNFSNTTAYVLKNGSRQLAQALDGNYLDAVIDDLSDKDKKLAEAYQNSAKALADAQEKVTEAQNKQSIIQNQIRLANKDIERQAAEDAKKAAEERKKQQEKNLKEYQKYLEDLQKVKDSLKAFAQKSLLDVDFSQVPNINTTDFQKMFFDSGRQSMEKEISVDLVFTEGSIREAEILKALNDVTLKWQQKFKDLKIEFPPIDYSKIKDPKELEEHLSKVADVTDKFRKILETGMEDAVIGFADGLGKAMAGGNLNAAFAAMMSAIGTAIQELGKTLIQSAIAIKAFKAAFNTLLMNPIAAVGVGAVMIAIGGAIKSSMDKLPKFAKGGVVPPGYPNDTYLARLTSGETIVPAGGEFDFAKKVLANYPDFNSFEINTRDLADRLQGFRAERTEVNVNVGGRFEISGYTLRLAIARANRQAYNFT